MQDLQQGTEIAAVSSMGTIDRGVIIEKAESPRSENVYIVRWTNDGTQTLFEVTEENLLGKDKKKNVKKKRNNRKKNKK